MKINTTSSLARSEDAELRAMGIERLLHTHPVDEEGESTLRQAIPGLEFPQLLELLHRHGDLDRPLEIVERLVEVFPLEEMGQLIYFWRLNVTSTVAKALDEHAYADFVEKVLPRVVAPMFQRELTGRLRGCALFNAVVAADSGRDPSSIAMAPGYLAMSLFEIRWDERACRTRLERLITDASRGELLRLEWVLAQASDPELTRQAERCLLDRFELKAGFDEDPEWEINPGHLAFVVRWVTTKAADHSLRLQWFADRVATLEKAGSWFHAMDYGRRLPAELVREVTVLLIDRDEPPRWAGAILIERLASRDVAAWNDVFRWWDRFGPQDLSWNHRERKAIVTSVPLPASAPADFDDKLLRCARDVIAFEHGQIELWQRGLASSRPTEEQEELSPLHGKYGLHLHPLVLQRTEHLRPLLTMEAAVERLLELELTAARVNGIARLLKQSPALLRHPRREEIAARVSPLDEDALPAFEVVDLDCVEEVALYRRLGGSAADDRLRAHIHEAIVGEDETSPWHQRFPSPSPYWISPWVLDLLDDALRNEMRARLAGAALPEVLAWSRILPAIVDEELIRGAAQRWLDAGKRWDRVERVPLLRPFVEQRLQRTEDDDELLAVLAWLEAHGLSGAAKLEAIIAELGRRPPTTVLEQIGTLLQTRSSWEEKGPRFLRAVLRWNDWGMIHRAWFALYQAVRHAPAPSEGTTARSEAQIDRLVTAVHLAFATVLLEMASAAAEARDEARVLALLAAVLKLDPPPAIVPALRRLTRWPDLSIRAREWIDHGTTLFKSEAGRSATFDALLNATNVMQAARPASAP